MFPHKEAPHGRRRFPRLTGEREKSALSQHARALGPRWEAHFDKLARRTGQLVELRQLRVKECVVGREEFHEAAVFRNQVMRKQPRLLAHRDRKLWREL